MRPGVRCCYCEIALSSCTLSAGMYNNLFARIWTREWLEGADQQGGHEDLAELLKVLGILLVYSMHEFPLVGGGDGLYFVQNSQTHPYKTRLFCI